MIWKIFELVAIASGAFYMVYEIRKSRKMWGWMIVSALFFLPTYLQKGYTSMAVIQIYYLVTAIYGLRQWNKVLKRSIEQHGENLPGGEYKIGISRISPKKMTVSLLVTAAVYALLLFINLRTFQARPGDIPGKPYIDTAVATFSMLATYWLSQSYFQQWYVWLVVNSLAIAMFIYPICVGQPGDGLLFTGLLYVYYMTTTVIGMVKWKRHGVIVE